MVIIKNNSEVCKALLSTFNKTNDYEAYMRWEDSCAFTFCQIFVFLFMTVIIIYSLYGIILKQMFINEFGDK